MEDWSMIKFETVFLEPFQSAEVRVFFNCCESTMPVIAGGFRVGCRVCKWIGLVSPCSGVSHSGRGPSSEGEPHPPWGDGRWCSLAVWHGAQLVSAVTPLARSLGASGCSVISYHSDTYLARLSHLGLLFSCFELFLLNTGLSAFSSSEGL